MAIANRYCRRSTILLLQLKDQLRRKKLSIYESIDKRISSLHINKQYCSKKFIGNNDNIVFEYFLFN